MESIEAIGLQIGRAIAPDFNKLTTSDLQGCIEAEVKKHGLTGTDAWEATEVALTYVYENAPDTNQG